MLSGAHILFASLFPLAMIGGAARDATSYTIPNWLSAALALAYLPAAFALGLSPAAIALGAGVGFAALLVGMGMFAAGWIGGGDAKLFAAAALWLGWSAVAPFLTWTAVAGGALAVLLLLLRRSPAVVGLGGKAWRQPEWIGRLLAPKGDVPYGVAICVGALAAFPASLVFRAAAGS